MDELLSIVPAVRALRDAGKSFLIATVVRVEGSAYRRAGARMILTETEWLAGSVSGGCLEGDIRRKGWWRTRSRPVVVTYDSRSDDDVRSGFGIGCEGSVDVLLERFDARPGICDPINLASRTLDDERPRALATVFRSDRSDVPVGARVAIDGDSVESTFDDERVCDELEASAEDAIARRGATLAAVDGGRIEALVEPIVPPPSLFVFGTGHDAVPVVSLAKSVGWSVTVVDRQARYSTLERFALADRRLVLGADDVAAAVDARARPLAVVMSHHYENDREMLRGLLASRASYIGMLGPRRRTERMLAELRCGGVVMRERDLVRVHAPVGLDVGAETPSEIALAIVAEAQATLSGAAAGRMRERKGPIHARFLDVSRRPYDASAE